MPVDDIIKLMLVMSVIVMPALGITARFALKPIVDALLRLRDGGVLPGDSSRIAAAEVSALTAHVARLEDELAQTRQEMARLKEAESFHLALRAEQPALPQETPPA